MSRKTKIISLLIFTALYILTRIPRSGTTIVNTDEVYWHGRSWNFTNALVNKDYKKTYQKYHPGVTLMWEISATAKMMSVLDKSDINEVFLSFERLHSNVQFVLTSWFFILLLFIVYLLNKATGKWWFSIISVTVLMLEPFYIGNSRLIHHDVQSSLYVLIAILSVYLYAERKSSLFFVFLSSFFLSLATLSKTLYLGAFLFCLFFGGLILIRNKDFKKLGHFATVLILSFLFFYILLFPALWVAPVETVKTMFTESFIVGEDEGHTQIFFGNKSRNPGALFYPVLFLLKSSPLLIIGFVLFLGKVFIDIIRIVIKREKLYKSEVPLVLFMSIFYIGYFLVITYFDKKVDRYFVPLYPWISILAVLGWSTLIKKKLLLIIPISLFLVTTAVQLVTIFPHYLMYVNPFIGDADKANQIIGQKLFGIGIFDLRDYIVKKYGDSTSIGTNDYGPLSSIYPNGRVYNVLVKHPNDFKIMVLGPNKDFPPSVKKDSNISYRYVESIYINGLEFWRIYKRSY